ncbi:MAG TPA: hypothetical protein V6D29_02690 [Leptolyngbyaceae cyanobacterium]
MTQTRSDLTLSNARGGLNLADAISLTASQQQLLRWILRQREVSLTQLAAHLGCSPAAAEVSIEDLLAAGFLQERLIGAEPYYRARLAPKQGVELPDSIHQSLLPGSALAVIPSPSGQVSVVAGSILEQRVTISNKGQQDALIDVSLTDLDKSSPISQWCASCHERLALGAQQSSEVIFLIAVPVQALPSTYNYRIVVDAPQHYPEDTPISCDQKLQVTPPVTETVRVTDPTFTVHPATSSTRPVPLQPGEALAVQILVHNRTDRVDRFRITCPDLDAAWYSVQYPEGLALPGLVMETDGLPLNPGAKGQITVLFTPPPNTLAGPYFPTISLHSANDPALMLLDVVYLEVLPVYALVPEWVPLRDKVKREAGEFDLRLANAGNTVRTVNVQLLDTEESKPYVYKLTMGEAAVAGGQSSTIAPDQPLIIAPGTTATVGLEVKPRPWWRRPFFGGGRLITFDVLLSDAQALPLAPPAYQGSLVWQPRPWWQLLLLILAGLGVLGTLLLAVWLLFLKPPAPPKILSFGAGDSTYAAADGDAIRLNWHIRNPKEIGALKLIGRSPEGTVLSPAITYSFAQGIPPELEGVCEQMRRELICQNVLTDARKAGNYIYELSVFPKNKPDEVLTSQKTDTIALTPITPPKITELVPAKLTYPDAKRQGRGTFVLLKWQVANPDQLKTLKLVGRRDDNTVSSSEQEWDFSQGVPDALKPFCRLEEALICQDVLVRVEKTGSTVFEMTALPKRAGEGDPATRKSDPIVIEALPPKIIAFKVNGTDAGPGYIVQLSQANPMRDITLDWEVEADPGTKIELLPAPGLVAPKGSLSYTISQQSSQQTITLQVTPENGQPITRAFTLEVFDASVAAPPNASGIRTPPAPSSAAGATPVAPGAPGAPGTLPNLPVAPGGLPGAGAGSPGGGGGSTNPLTPSEVPPQFD